MIVSTHTERPAALNLRRDLKMARSAHAYVRGNTARFYEWLAESEIASHIPQGPPVWICGDCHLGNLGPLANSEARVEIQIRDLDQAVIGNPAHDLIRLGLSLATAARGSDLPGVTTARMIERMVEGYENALADPTGDNPSEEPDAVRVVRRRALGRRWRHLAKERLEDVEPKIPLGNKFWALDEAEQQALPQALLDPAVAAMVLSLDGRKAERSIKLADAAYWVKRCSSLGLKRFAAIVTLRSDERKSHVLLDIKQAVEAVAPADRHAAMPANQAERVVAAAKALSPYLGERIAPLRMLGHSFFIRELMPQDLKIEVDQFSERQAVKASEYLAFVVGKAHARQMDRSTRINWLAALQKGRSSALDAPSWLWQSIVALSARHEAGYLEHCRIYALATAA